MSMLSSRFSLNLKVRDTRHARPAWGLLNAFRIRNITFTDGQVQNLVATHLKDKDKDKVRLRDSQFLGNEYFMIQLLVPYIARCAKKLLPVGMR